MAIKVGDFVRIPTGTEIFALGYAGPGTSIRTERTLRVKVTEMPDLRKHDPWSLLSKAEVKEFMNRKFLSDWIIGDWCIENLPECPEIVVWGKYNDKYAFVNDVEKVEEAKITKRKVTFAQQCVKDSQWKLIGSIAAGKQTGNWGIEIKIDDKLVVGEIVTVCGKSKDYFVGYDAVRFVPVKDKNGRKCFVVYADLKNNSEVIFIPEVKLYKIRDRETGLFYNGTVWIRTEDGYGKYTGPSYDKKGKEYKNFGALKSSMLSISGVFQYDESLPYDCQPPEWINNSYPCDIPDTWEIIEVEKFSKKEKIVKFNVQKYIEHAKRLKRLSGMYGYAVKKVYSDLEKENLLSEFHGMVVFTQPLSKYGEPVSLPKATYQEIKELVAETFPKNIDYKIVHKNVSAAVTFKDINDAVLLRLSYPDSDIKVTVVNLDELTEVIEEKI